MQNQYAFKQEWLYFYANNGFLIHAHHYRLPDGACSCTRVPWNTNKTCTQGVGGHPVLKFAGITEAQEALKQTREQLQRDPGYNFILRTGSCAGVIAIDVDVKEGRNGLQSLSDLCRRLNLDYNSIFEQTPHAITGSGGFHFLFASPNDGGPPITNTQSALGEHIDVRGENGYILVHPSVHKSTGNVYQWKVMPYRASLQVLPEALLAELRKTQSAARSSVFNSAPRTVAPAPSLSEMKSWAKTVKGRAKTRLTGEIALSALDGQPFPYPRGQGNEMFFKLASDIAEGWPNNDPMGIAEHFRDAIKGRQDQLGASTTVEEVAGLIEREQLKAHAEKTGSNRWRYGKGGYLRDDQGRPRYTVANTLIPLRHHSDWQGVLGYNVRTHNACFLKKPPIPLLLLNGYPQDIADEAIHVVSWLQAEEGIVATRGMAEDALRCAASLNPFNPVADWIRSLPPWDGVNRTEHLLQQVGGVEDTEWARACQKRWFISLVARIMAPGCKVDTMLILNGAQGYLKSSFFRELMPREEWFADALRTPDLAESTIRLMHSGPVLFEIAEMQGFKLEAIANIKAFLSASSDQLRNLYQKHKGAPRSFIIVGTTNEAHFLHDATGGRRFWPLTVQRCIDVELVRTLRDQLFAEAYHRYCAKEKWWLTAEEEIKARAEQEKHYDQHPWHSIVATMLANKLPADRPQVLSPMGCPDFVTIEQIFEHVLEIPKVQWSPKAKAELRNILIKEGWVRARKRLGPRDASNPVQGFSRPM